MRYAGESVDVVGSALCVVDDGPRDVVLLHGGLRIVGHVSDGHAYDFHSLVFPFLLKGSELWNFLNAVGAP